MNRGEAGGSLSPGEDVADRYYLMYLYSWGPEFYYYDDLSLARINSAAEGVSRLNREAEPESAGSLPNRAPLESVLGLCLYDLDHPQPYIYERTGPRYRLEIEGRRYRPQGHRPQER